MAQPLTAEQVRVLSSPELLDQFQEVSCLSDEHNMDDILPLLKAELLRRLTPTIERHVWVVEDKNDKPKRAQTFKPTRLGMLDDEHAILYVPHVPTINAEGPNLGSRRYSPCWGHLQAPHSKMAQPSRPQGSRVSITWSTCEPPSGQPQTHVMVE